MFLCIIRIVLVLFFADGSSGVKIAMFHMFGGSHFLTTKAIATELTSRGHEVSICFPGNKTLPKNSKIKVVNFHPGFEKESVEAGARQLIHLRGKDWKFKMEAFGRVMGAMSTLCKGLITDETVQRTIRNADLLLIEIPVICGPTIAKLHKKKWIGILPGPPNSPLGTMLRIPTNPSHIPFFQSSFSTNMTIYQRLLNFALHKAFDWIFPLAANHLFMEVKTLLKIPAYENILDAMMTAEMLISSCDFTVDYPSPLMPNMFCVGPFLTEPAKHLPKEFNSSINTTDGFILAAFGTVFNTFTKEQVKRMAGAFKTLKQRVIWQLQDNYDIPLPENVVSMKWLPQNDLLGHPNIKLFISHMGISSLHQAVYHGVPVLATPRAGDQWGNAYRLKNRVEMAEVIDLESISQEDFLTKIHQVMNGDSYTKNAKKASRRLRSRKQTPMQLAGDLIEYVIDNDYDVSHLRSPGLDLPWYIHDLWDVYLLITIITAIICYLMYQIIRLVCRMTCRWKLKKE